MIFCNVTTHWTWPDGKGKYQSMGNTKIGKKGENYCRKMKRSPVEKHT